MIPLVTESVPAPNRVDTCNDDMERHLKEPAIQLAMAAWLLAQGAEHVSIHPDGQHLKQFNMRGWLEARGFVWVEPRGKTEQGGLYQNGGSSVELFPASGRGDVVAMIGEQKFEVEAKGGCINTRNSGQKSKLRKGLAEAVGQLMTADMRSNRLIAALPFTNDLRNLAERMVFRTSQLGIEIALVHEGGEVEFVSVKG